MHSLFRARQLPLLWAALLSLTLLTSSVLAAHVHLDGLPHYSDCDTCLQASSLDSITHHDLPQVTLTVTAPDSGDYDYHFNSSRYRLFQSRAPPSILTLH